MTGTFCDCGFYARTLNTLRAHAKICSRADAILRRREDKARLDRVARAKDINQRASDAWWKALRES